MTYTIIIVACLLSQPTDCRTYERPVSGFSSHPSAAFVQAQGWVAEWETDHPAFRVEKWRLIAGQPA